MNPHPLAGDWWLNTPAELWPVAVKVVLIYVITLACLRIAHRRIRGQWTAIDFIAAVGVGSILGRTAVASNQSLLVGVVGVVSLLTVHWLLTVVRYEPRVARMLDHPVRVLVDHGRVRPDQLRASGLTEGDLHARLRQDGVGSLLEVRYVLYENRGGMTVVRETDDATPDPDLVREVIAEAEGSHQPGRLQI